MKNIGIVFLILAMCWSCTTGSNDKANGNGMDPSVISATTDSLVSRFGNEERSRIVTGLNQVAALWRSSDGTAADFTSFCIEHYAPSGEKRDLLFDKLQEKMEILNGSFGKMGLDLKWNLEVDKGQVHPVDEWFGAYDPASHLQEDMYTTKIAFVVALNFSHYTLKEKQVQGEKWTPREWAYARMGDLYTARVPSGLLLKNSEVQTRSDMYISRYNIYAGKLRDTTWKTLFPEDLVLLSHWNLRDEIKANYGKEKGLEKQLTIYEVMKHIITQNIPVEVINSGDLLWNPFTHELFKDTDSAYFEYNPATKKTVRKSDKVTGTPEGGKRYQQILDNFHALKAMDTYYSDLNTYILRKSDGEMELTVEETEALFTSFLSSPEMKAVAEIVKKRLGRDLQPFDIWYDGFKSRSSLGAINLDEIVARKYPTAAAFEKDIPNILLKLGFAKDKADFIASRISVDPARGSGHAWGAPMHSVNSHLRTRVVEGGMNYKGYNIAVHELGHNVEQTISLHEVDNYLMSGVPNTAFTEALAFLFQERDLQLLGINSHSPEAEDLAILDKYWASCEIMGVSLVDIRMWKWLYEHPEATKEQLQEQVIAIAKEVWNQYFAPVYGVKDVYLFAIYSHMVSYPLYLPAYAVGGLIQFQIDEYMKGKKFAAEVERIFSQGRMVPQVWMKKAVGSEISAKPLIEKTKEVLIRLN
ncbi:MAG: hypothetical protein U0T82_08800 [Bacteroidales bacterium]